MSWPDWFNNADKDVIRKVNALGFQRGLVKVNFIQSLRPGSHVKYTDYYLEHMVSSRRAKKLRTRVGIVEHIVPRQKDLPRIVYVRFKDEGRLTAVVECNLKVIQKGVEI